MVSVTIFILRLQIFVYHLNVQSVKFLYAGKYGGLHLHSSMIR